jgi:hypothetical protein
MQEPVPVWQAQPHPIEDCSRKPGAVTATATGAAGPAQACVSIHKCTSDGTGGVAASIQWGADFDATVQLASHGACESSLCLFVVRAP